ncbi:alpha/beta fold hydrolase [Microbacterium luticocti]|uniref:alpha/beta fold hydrolase n=1 Tax=Microbacterium luticocti TaxID=451764 RepID=UPI0003F67739|nr:alpha/beta fold hydrolase [Microbacterium luticocti]
MTTIDEHVRRDGALADIDWHVFPPGTVRDTVATPSGALARVRVGDASGDRVLLVPGVVGSKEDFVRIVPLLVQQGLRVESFDLAGHYESEHAPPLRDGHYDFAQYVDDLIAVLRADPAPAHVVGYSFGGLLVQQAAVACPELMRTVTLLSCPPATGQVFRGVAHIGPLSDMDPHRAAGLILWGIRYNLNRERPQRIAFVRERLSRIPRSCIDDVIGMMMHTPDVTEAFAALGLPTLIAVGRRDLWPVAQHRAYARRIGARVALYPGGHAPCETAPHQLVRDLVGLFRE